MTDFWGWQRELVAKLCDEISGLMKTPTAQCAVAEGDSNPSVCVAKQAGDDWVAVHQCGEAVPQTHIALRFIGVYLPGPRKCIVHGSGTQ